MPTKTLKPSSKIATPPVPNEVWRAYALPTGPLAYFQKTHEMILVGFNPLTKVKLHEYGPFDTDGELASFCRENGIPLPEGYRFK